MQISDKLKIFEDCLKVASKEAAKRAWKRIIKREREKKMQISDKLKKVKLSEIKLYRE